MDGYFTASGPGLDMKGTKRKGDKGTHIKIFENIDKRMLIHGSRNAEVS
jgi:hypothetical protein